MSQVGVNGAFRRLEVDRSNALERRCGIDRALCKRGKRDKPGDIPVRATFLDRIPCATSRGVLRALARRCAARSHPYVRPC